MKAFYIPGLATNHRLFEALIKRLGGSVLEWIEPENEESFENYSQRLAMTLQDEPIEEICLVGFCFGGAIALELAQHLNVGAVVTLNSPGDSGDISDDFRKGVEIGIKIPQTLLKGLVAAKGPRFFAERDDLNEEQTKVVAQMLKEIDFHFLNWAAQASVCWSRPSPPDTLCPRLGLHGRLDQITRPPQNMAVEILEEVGHLTPLTHPDLVGSRIQQFWKNIPNQ